MAEIAQVKAQIAKAREALKQKREEVSQVEQRLIKQRKALPEFRGQRALRGKVFGGLKGRERRRQIIKAEEFLGGQREKVKGFGEELTKYEETKLKPVEAEVRRVEAYQAALKSVEKHKRKGMLWAIAMHGEGLERSIARKMMKYENLAKTYQRRIDDVITKHNVSGIESLSLKESNFLERLKESGQIELEEIIDSFADVSRTDKVQVVPDMIDSISMPSKIEDRTWAGRALFKAGKGLTAGVGALASVPFATTTLGGLGKEISRDLPQVIQTSKKVGKAVLDVPFAEGTIGTTAIDTSKIVTKGIDEFGEMAALSQEYSRQFQPAEHILPEGFKTARGKVEKFVYKAAPYAMPVLGQALIVTEGIAIAERSRPEYIAKETKDILKEQWKIYQEEPEPEEGFRKLTESEFAGEVSPQIKEQVKKGLGKEALFLGGALVGGAVIGGAWRGGSKVIPKKSLGGLSINQFKRVVKKLEPEIKTLEKQPVRWLATQEEGTGKILLKGFQDSGKLSREFVLKAKLKKTETGKLLIPEGTAESMIKGEIMYKGKPISYIAPERFKVGAKDIALKKVDQVGDVVMFLQIGKVTTIPKIQTFALFKGKIPKDIKPKVFKKKIEPQLLKFAEFGGKPIADISPRLVTRIKPKMYFTYGEKELGLTFIKSIKKPKVTFGKKYVGAKKTPLSKTFQLTETKEVPLLFKTPKPPKPRVPKVEVVTKVETLPYMVGGKGLKLDRIKYVGAGVYEQQTSTVTRISPDAIVLDKQKSYVYDAQVPKVGSVFKVKTKLDSQMDFKTRLILKSVPITKVSISPKIGVKDKVVMKTKYATKYAVKTKYVTKTVTKTKPVTTPKPITPRRIPTIKTRIKFEFESDPLKKKKLKKKGELELVAPFIRRRGKFVKAGKFVKKEKALKVGVRKLKTGLAASLQLRTKTGRKVKIARETKLFRAGAKGKDPFTLVQKRKKRLVTPQERQEIALSRRKGGIKFIK